MTEQQSSGIKTVGRAKEKFSEAMFCLAALAGGLHFLSIVMQVSAMFMHTTLKIELALPFTSSMLMGHLYLAFLSIYVGQKEYVRWQKRGDEEILTDAEGRKITRGTYFVMIWGVFALLVTFIWQSGLIAEVPDVLLYTLGEIVALFGGTEASKYLRTRKAVQGKQDTADRDNYGDRVVDYCREKGSINRPECQNEFGLSEDQAYRLLKRLVKDKQLVEFGEKKDRRYKLP